MFGSVARLSREESREQTRKKLRRSAAANFAKHGFEGASVDQISEDAGFSRGAFYSNFADKEAIFLDLLVHHLDNDIVGFKRAASESQTLEELADRIAVSYRDLGENPDWCLLASEFQLYASRSGRSDSAFARVYASYRDELSTVLAAAFEKFGFRHELSSKELASALIGLSHGLALERAASGGTLPMEVTGKALRALVFGGNQKRPGR